MINTIRQEIKELRDSNKDPIDFAIEAIRLNITVACFKDETLLHEAMLHLQSMKKRSLLYGAMLRLQSMKEQS